MAEINTTEEGSPLPFLFAEESSEEDDAARRKSRTRIHLPGVASRVPQYEPIHDQQRRKALTYFDEKGRPRIATAQEIAPPEDFPYSLPLWWAMNWTYRLLHGDKIWPLNVQHNVVLYYLLGKRARFIELDFAFPLILFVAFALDIFLLLSPGLAGDWAQAFCVLSIVPAALLLLAATAYFTGTFLRYFTGDQLGEELSLTRLTHAEFSYALLIRLLSPGLFWVLTLGIVQLATLGGVLSFVEIFQSLSTNALKEHVEVLFIPAVFAVFIKSITCLIIILVSFTCAYHARFRWAGTDDSTNEQRKIVELLPNNALVSIAAVVSGFMLFMGNYQLVGIFFFLFGFNRLLGCANSCLMILIWYVKKPNASDFIWRKSEP